MILLRNTHQSVFTYNLSLQKELDLPNADAIHTIIIQHRNDFLQLIEFFPEVKIVLASAESLQHFERAEVAFIDATFQVLIIIN